MSEEIEDILFIDPESGKPRIRWECKQGPRPCPWMSCRYNTVIDDIRLSADGKEAHISVGAKNKRGKGLLRASDEKVLELWESYAERGVSNCVLDHVENEHCMTLEEVGQVYGLTRERIRQVEYKGLKRVAKKDRILGRILSDNLDELLQAKRQRGD